MNRYRQYGPQDDIGEPVGDIAFKRLDMLGDPATLAPETVQRSENMRFDTAGAQVRGGVAPQFRPGTAIGAILFAGIYRPDTGNDRLALVTTGALVLFNPADQSTEVHYYPGGETCSAPVDLVQAGISSGTLPDLYILRGEDQDALKFDGATVATSATFKRGDFALFYQDRVAVATSSQGLHVSDFLDFATWTQLSQFQVLKGGDDYLIGFLAWQNDKVLIGTRKAWFVAYFDPTTDTGGYTGGLQASTSFVRVLTREAGPVGRLAMKEAAGRIWFVTDGAIYAFVPQLDLQLTVLGKPISAEIQPVMDRLSASHAAGACIEHFGYRLYFALPIGGEAVKIAGVSVQSVATLGLDLPFDLPNSLAAGAIATFATAAAHGLQAGDTVQLTGLVDPLLNGTGLVQATPDDTHFAVAVDAAAGATTGTAGRVQWVATRNNTIAVYNLYNDGWESIDTLPAGMFADRLVVAEYGARRRLWVVDQDAGPALYEEGEVDVIGEVVGGVSLPFDLPVELSAADFERSPIAGRLKSRRFRWGAFARKVIAGEARVELGDGEACTVTLTTYTPGRESWSKTRSLDGDSGDRGRRIRCGRRDLEAELEVVATSGRPQVRGMVVETTQAGRSKEQ